MNDEDTASRPRVRRELERRFRALEHRSAALERSVRHLRVFLFCLCWLATLAAAVVLVRTLRAL